MKNRILARIYKSAEEFNAQDLGDEIFKNSKQTVSKILMAIINTLTNEELNCIKEAKNINDIMDFKNDKPDSLYYTLFHGPDTEMQDTFLDNVWPVLEEKNPDISKQIMNAYDVADKYLYNPENVDIAIDYFDEHYLAEIQDVFEENVFELLKTLV